MSESPSIPPSGHVPVFPLPSVVFFPRTILPLHVFEPRYRAMVEDALRGERLIAVSLLRPGWERDYHGNPEFHDVGTVGRVEAVESLPDGRFNLQLVGLRRVRFGSVVSSEPYRRVEVTSLRETTVDETEERILSAKLDLLASQGCLARELRQEKGPGIVLDDRIPFETAVNGACANLPLEPAARQDLLEENDLWVRQQRVSALLDEVLKRVLHLKSLRGAEDEGGSGLN